MLSWAWILASLFACFLMASLLLRRIGEFYLALLGLITLYGISAAHEPRASFWALVVLVPAAFIAFVLPRRTSETGDWPFGTGRL